MARRNIKPPIISQDEDDGKRRNGWSTFPKSKANRSHPKSDVTVLESVDRSNGSGAILVIEKPHTTSAVAGLLKGHRRRSNRIRNQMNDDEQDIAYMANREGELTTNDFQSMNELFGMPGSVQDSVMAAEYEVLFLMKKLVELRSREDAASGNQVALLLQGFESWHIPQRVRDQLSVYENFDMSATVSGIKKIEEYLSNLIKKLVNRGRVIGNVLLECMNCYFSHLPTQFMRFQATDDDELWNLNFTQAKLLLTDAQTSARLTGPRRFKEKNPAMVFTRPTPPRRSNRISIRHRHRAAAEPIAQFDDTLSEFGNLNLNNDHIDILNDIFEGFESEDDLKEDEYIALHLAQKLLGIHMHENLWMHDGIQRVMDITFSNYTIPAFLQSRLDRFVDLNELSSPSLIQDAEFKVHQLSDKLMHTGSEAGRVAMECLKCYFEHEPTHFMKHLLDDADSFVGLDFTEALCKLTGAGTVRKREETETEEEPEETEPKRQRPLKEKEGVFSLDRYNGRILSMLEIPSKYDASTNKQLERIQIIQKVSMADRLEYQNILRFYTRFANIVADLYHTNKSFSIFQREINLNDNNPLRNLLTTLRTAFPSEGIIVSAKKKEHARNNLQTRLPYTLRRLSAQFIYLLNNISLGFQNMNESWKILFEAYNKLSQQTSSTTTSSTTSTTTSSTIERKLDHEDIVKLQLFTDIKGENIRLGQYFNSIPSEFSTPSLKDPYQLKIVGRKKVRSLNNIILASTVQFRYTNLKTFLEKTQSYYLNQLKKLETEWEALCKLLNDNKASLENVMDDTKTLSKIVMILIPSLFVKNKEMLQNPPKWCSSAMLFNYESIQKQYETTIEKISSENTNGNVIRLLQHRLHSVISYSDMISYIDTILTEEFYSNDSTKIKNVLNGLLVPFGVLLQHYNVPLLPGEDNYLKMMLDENNLEKSLKFIEEDDKAIEFFNNKFVQFEKAHAKMIDSRLDFLDPNRISNVETLSHLQMVLVSFYHIPNYLSTDMTNIDVNKVNEAQDDSDSENGEAFNDEDFNRSMSDYIDEKSDFKDKHGVTLATCQNNIKVVYIMWHYLNELSEYLVEKMKTNDLTVYVKSSFVMPMRTVLRKILRFLDLIIDHIEKLYTETMSYANDLYQYIGNMKHKNAATVCHSLLKNALKIHSVHTKTDDELENALNECECYFEDVDLLMFRIIYHHGEYQTMINSFKTYSANTKEVLKNIDKLKWTQDELQHAATLKNIATAIPNQFQNLMYYMDYRNLYAFNFPANIEKMFDQQIIRVNEVEKERKQLEKDIATFMTSIKKELPKDEETFKKKRTKYVQDNIASLNAQSEEDKEENDVVMENADEVVMENDDTLRERLKKQYRNSIESFYNNAWETFIQLYERLILYTKRDLATSNTSSVNEDQLFALVTSIERNIIPVDDDIENKLKSGILCTEFEELADDDEKKLKCIENMSKFFEASDLLNQWEYLRAAKWQIQYDHRGSEIHTPLLNELEDLSIQKRRRREAKLASNSNDTPNPELISFETTTEPKFGYVAKKGGWLSMFEIHKMLFDFWMDDLQVKQIFIQRRFFVYTTTEKDEEDEQALFEKEVRRDNRKRDDETIGEEIKSVRRKQNMELDDSDNEDAYESEEESADDNDDDSEEDEDGEEDENGEDDDIEMQ